MDLDPESADRHKMERAYRLDVIQTPMLRVVGGGMSLAVLYLHNKWILGDLNATGILWYAACSAAFWALSWAALVLGWRRLYGRFDLGLLFLALDPILWIVGIYVGGGERSWLFMLLLLRVADQSHSTFRRALAFALFLPLVYGGMLGYVAGVDGHTLDWWPQATKVALLLGGGVYIALTAKVAEAQREQTRAAVRLAREQIRRQEAQAEALEAARRGAEEANRAKSDFLAGMGHELRTPMNAVLLYSQLVRETAVELGNEELMSDMEKIHGAGNHLLQMVNDLLDLSKIEAGKMSRIEERLELPVLLEEVRDTVGPLVAQRGNQLQVDQDPELREILSDGTRLRQILFNLLGNASKFTEKGTITLRTRREGPWAVFEVQDTGIGMTARQMERLFQPYQQAEAGTAREYGGTGLGLMLSKRLCALLGGEIGVASEPGKGTTFIMRFPVGSAPSNLPPGPRTLLVLREDPSFLQDLGVLLEPDGFRIHAVENAEEAVRFAREHPPDAIVLELCAPDLSGWSVLKVLRAEPTLAALPVVLTTLGKGPTGFAFGPAEILEKPLDVDRCRRLLRRFLPPGQEGYALVVEDDPAQRRALRKLLHAEGWRVTEAGHGGEALERLREHPLPDLVLLDLAMPEMDGFEFMDALRRNPAWARFPVVVLTSMSLTEADRGRLVGPNAPALLDKGLPRKELLMAVWDLVRRSW